MQGYPIIKLRPDEPIDLGPTASTLGLRNLRRHRGGLRSDLDAYIPTSSSSSRSDQTIMLYSSVSHARLAFLLDQELSSASAEVMASAAVVALMTRASVS